MLHQQITQRINGRTRRGVTNQSGAESALGGSAISKSLEGESQQPVTVRQFGLFGDQGAENAGGLVRPRGVQEFNTRPQPFNCSGGRELDIHQSKPVSY
jgi:hypothetical protein